MSKQNSKAHYDSHNAGPEWGTPEWIWKPLANSLVNGFTLDPASGAEPSPIASNRYTVEDNGLEQEWHGHVWLNPPYGRNHNPQWGEKTKNEWQAGNVKSITALIPASTETDWFQDNYARADVLTFVDSRVKFIGGGDNGASFPSVIATFGLEAVTRDYVSALKQIGKPYPNTQQILVELIKNGASPAQAIDYYFTEFADYNRTEWANIRGVGHSSISKRVKSVTLSHTLQQR